MHVLLDRSKNQQEEANDLTKLKAKSKLGSYIQNKMKQESNDQGKYNAYWTIGVLYDPTTWHSVPGGAENEMILQELQELGAHFSN